MMISGSSQNLATPAAPTATVRNAQSNETALSTAITDIYVAAVNYFGTTAISSGVSVSVGSGQVVDVTISPVAAALNYDIWGYDGTHYYKLATCGGVKYTLQGALPATATQPTTDSGTGKGTRFEGVIPTLTGLSSSAGIYPSGWQGGYVNNAVGTHLSYNVMYTALESLWDSPDWITGNGPFKADPAEIISSGTDIANLSQDVISNGSGTNYQLFINQAQAGGVSVGAAVSQFENPVTKSTLKTVVHPFYLQGSADLISYQLPQSWTNVANAWEMSCVQDYVSLAWPAIDVTWRFSILLFGAMVAHAPQYSAHLGGLQRSDVAPFS